MEHTVIWGIGISVLQQVLDELKKQNSINEKLLTAITSIKVFQPIPFLPKEFVDFLARFKFKVYASVQFERTIDFTSAYVKLFHAEQVKPDLAMCLVGLEDQEDGNKPDGWTDILLPVFYDNVALTGCPEMKGKFNFFVDMALSGGYAKEVWFKTNGAWKLLFTYSVEKGLCYGSTDIMTSVGYVEYCPELDLLCTPKLS